MTRTDTGVRLGTLNGVVTERRTAALSLLAVKTLAAVPNGPLLISARGSGAGTPRGVSRGSRVRASVYHLPNLQQSR